MAFHGFSLSRLRQQPMSFRRTKLPREQKPAEAITNVRAVQLAGGEETETQERRSDQTTRWDEGRTGQTWGHWSEWGQWLNRFCWESFCFVLDLCVPGRCPGRHVLLLQHRHMRASGAFLCFAWNDKVPKWEPFIVRSMERPPRATWRPESDLRKDGRHRVSCRTAVGADPTWGHLN